MTTIARLVRGALIAGLLAAPAAFSSASAAPADDAGDSVVASFEGSSIRLADGWGEAHACISDDAGTRCYRSEEEMDKTEGSRVVPAAACSGSLRLYSATGHSGDVLALSQCLVVINLSGYGFNNVASSYKIGPCSASFYDTTGGSTVYPGNTSAGASASSMSSGWDNRVGSVYIH